jgi:hypothetical protein
MLELNNKQVAIAVLVALAVGATAGFYAKPEKVVTKVEIKKETVEVVKVVEKETKNVRNDKELVIIETRFPDGTVKKEKRYVDKSTVDSIKDRAENKQTVTKEEDKKSTEIVNRSEDWHVSVGYELLPQQKYQLTVERKIFGPLYVGAFGRTDKSIGVSVGGGF